MALKMAFTGTGYISKAHAQAAQSLPACVFCGVHPAG